MNYNEKRDGDGEARLDKAIPTKELALEHNKYIPSRRHLDRGQTEITERVRRADPESARVPMPAGRKNDLSVLLDCLRRDRSEILVESEALGIREHLLRTVAGRHLLDPLPPDNVVVPPILELLEMCLENRRPDPVE